MERGAKGKIQRGIETGSTLPLPREVCHSSLAASVGKKRFFDYWVWRRQQRDLDAS